MTREKPYEKVNVLDLVLLPLCWWGLEINFITFNTQVIFNAFHMLIEIWCANIKQHMKKKIQICVFLCLSVTILPLHDTSLCGSFSLLPSLTQSHLDTAAILLFSYLPCQVTLILFCFVFTNLNICIVFGFIRLF